MNKITNATIQNSVLNQNTIDHDDYEEVEDTKGMGGTVALFGSELMITNCSFYQNFAKTYNHDKKLKNIFAFLSV